MDSIECARSFCVVLYKSIGRLLDLDADEIVKTEEHLSVCENELWQAQTISQLIAANQNVIDCVSLQASRLRENQNQLIKTVNAFILKNYMNNVTVKNIADAVHLTPKYLSHMYKKNTEKNIIDRLNETRVQKAKELLKEPGSRVSDIAYQVGFSDASYFTRVFIRYTGISPSDYKVKT